GAVDAGSDRVAEQDPAYVQSVRRAGPSPPAEASERRRVGPADRRTLDIPCQPAVEFRGRIQEWIAEVRRMRERGDTVLFVAGTEGRAERTVELLAEYDLRGVMLDRTDELLNVAISVTVGQLSKGFRLPTA